MQYTKNDSQFEIHTSLTDTETNEIYISAATMSKPPHKYMIDAMMYNMEMANEKKEEYQTLMMAVYKTK